MNAVRLVLCLVAAVPAAWFASALYDRVPPRRPLLRPLPGLRLHGPYLAILAMTLVLFGVAAVRFDQVDVVTLVAYLVFLTAAAALSAIDVAVQRLPDAIVGGALVVSIPLVTVASLRLGAPDQIRFALVGGLTYFGFLLLTHLAFPGGMGFGDVKLAALMGLFVGWLATSALTAVVLVLYAMLVGFLVGSAVGVVLFAFHRRSRHYPFGPFLLGGAIVVIAFSAQLLPV